MGLPTSLETAQNGTYGRLSKEGEESVHTLLIKEIEPTLLTRSRRRPYRHTCATRAQVRAAHIAGYALAVIPAQNEPLSCHEPRF